nr:hypothetical protein CFP56_46603 [Quercus suber]
MDLSQRSTRRRCQSSSVASGLANDGTATRVSHIVMPIQEQYCTVLYCRLPVALTIKRWANRALCHARSSAWKVSRIMHGLHIRRLAIARGMSSTYAIRRSMVHSTCYTPQIVLAVPSKGQAVPHLSSATARHRAMTKIYILPRSFRTGTLSAQTAFRYLGRDLRYPRLHMRMINSCTHMEPGSSGRVVLASDAVSGKECHLTQRTGVILNLGVTFCQPRSRLVGPHVFLFPVA